MNDEAPDQPDEPLEKQRFLLPDGCKDLIDALRLRPIPPPRDVRSAGEPGVVDAPVPVVLPEGHWPFLWPEPTVSPPTSVSLPESMNIRDLAQLLGLKPYHLLQALMQANVMASVATELAFETAAVICRGYGISVVKKQ